MSDPILPLLVLEGSDEWHLLRSVDERIAKLFPDNTMPKSRKGENVSGPTIAKRLSTALLSSEKGTVCVICDAESTGPQKQWDDIKEVLSNQGYPDLPDQCPPDGYLGSRDELKRVGVWIMPNNLDNGMLEDFYLSAIPANNPELLLADPFVRSIMKPLFKDKISKATLGVWLGIQKNPVSAGVALKRNWIEKDSGHFPPFLVWLARLFPEEL